MVAAMHKYFLTSFANSRKHY